MKKQLSWTLQAGLLLSLIPMLLLGVTTQGSESSDERPYTLSLSVDLVALDVAVFDRQGTHVLGLEKENFRIFEDGQPQEIQLFSKEDLPATIGLIVDNSGSMRAKRAEVNTAMLAFVSSRNPADEMFVINFNEKVNLDLPNEVPFTSQWWLLKEALSRWVPRGQTALFDAVVEGLAHLKKGKLQKKALVLLTDGGDNASDHEFKETLTIARKSDATIYSVGLYESWNRDRNPKALKRLSKVSGGESFFPSSADEVQGICLNVAKTIRNQYTLGYHPTNAARDGAYRKVRVEVEGPGLKKAQVRTREGYFAPAD